MSQISECTFQTRHTENASKQTRLSGIDRLRGLAVFLMIIDHSVLVFASDSVIGRFTVTRAALPLFCILAGSLSKSSPNWPRLVDVAGAGVAATFIGLPVGIGQPDILLLLALGLAVLPYVASLPFLVVCIIAPFSWPVPWSGYHPGAVIALLIVGYRFVDRRQLHDIGEVFPAVFTFPGRYPLTIYIVHLVVLWLLKS